MILDGMKPRKKSKLLILAPLLASFAMLVLIACSSGTDDSNGSGDSGDGAGDSDGLNLPSFVEIAAPIESVEIVKVAAKSPNASLVIVSGGLNSCESFKDYQISRDGDVFRVQVTNLRTVSAGIPCTANYGTQEHSIELPSNEIAGCETYRVEVNGAIYTVEASCPALATGPSVSERVEALSPIVRAEVGVLESSPAQYRLNIESALPNGCIEFGGYEIVRVGERIKVAVTNLVPADEDVVCDQQYRTVKTTVDLGTGLDYQPSTRYTVEVNDVSTEFVTDAAGTAPVATGPGFDEPFELKIGESANVGSDGLTVEFVEVVEGSRCPSDVTCVWAGRALVMVIVSSPGDVLGFGAGEIILEAGKKDAEENRVIGDGDSYQLTLLELAPDPVSTVKLTSQDYTATL